MRVAVAIVVFLAVFSVIFDPFFDNGLVIVILLFFLWWLRFKLLVIHGEVVHR